MSDAKPSSAEGIPKWQIALAVGGTLALGAAGVWYFTRKTSKNDERKEPDGGPAPEEQADEPIPEPEVELSPLEKAQGAKNKGNKYFKGGKFEEAIKCYSEALEVCPDTNKKEMSTFYQNRAAAYEQLKSFREVVDDCTKALELDNKYIKALFRRAKAYERIDEKKQCLEDVTAVCILEGFQNQQSMMMADRILKDMGWEKAKEKYKNREPVLPSTHFIKAYFSSFTEDIISQPLDKMANDEDKDQEGELGEAEEAPVGDYLKAKRYFQEENYDKIIGECSKEIDSQGEYLAHALLMRATFHMLMGQAPLARPDLDMVINMDTADKKLRCNALIKRGSMLMQRQQSEEALQDFQTAVDLDQENSDVYHHRGQLNLLLDRVPEALRDFEKCCSLKPDFALATVQYNYTQYRAAMLQRSAMQVQDAMKQFEESISKFPDCAEGYVLYAQALGDQQMFDKADDNYKKAISLEPQNATTYVHRGLLHLQWKQDIDAGLSLIQKALDIDDRCDFAYETMGTIEVQRGNLEKAIELFNKAISIAKTEMEIAHLYSLCDAAVAQSEVAKKYGLRPQAMM
ncbi:mitochondrial import receptor subunit TOM70-like [Branchiostoma floridae]|uniref:Mitochondrial import receptor subunit TOM70-like n=1 Tax=Branchiostoma floridae TaxID=7739 RepID=A0A9J7KWX0_BRAFL|nr:mitochondrial import receptor subunit TOM70-like [Branchiostoma floridae]